MEEYDPKRRLILQLLLTTPMAMAVGCDLSSRGTAGLAPLLSPEDSIRKLIAVVGPWNAAEQAAADDFVRRFLQAAPVVGNYLPESGERIQQLARRFPAGAMAVEEIDLEPLSTEERALLLQLVAQIYSFLEVRFYVAGEPPFGECQMDPNWHTRTPGS